MLSRIEPDGKTISYTYNDSGKLESIITDSVITSYTYDSFNFLDKVTANGEVTDYDYDALGNLVQTTLANGVVETRYLVDANREHAEVIEEYTTDGTTKVSYVHGLNMISAERDGSESYYVHDGHSGVRQLTDENGVVTNHYDYDGYGNLLNFTGSTENNYLYRGEQFDPELGMQYLRQRYYDTSAGRFASVDPFSGLVEQGFLIKILPLLETLQIA